MPTIDELSNSLAQADAAGDKEAAQAFADAIREQQGASQAPARPMGGAGGNWGPEQASVSRFLKSTANLGMRGVAPAVGQALGALTGPFAEIGVPVLGGVGGMIGELGAQFNEGTFPTRGQLGAAAMIGAIPGASLAKATVPTVAKTALKYGTGATLAALVESSLDNQTPPSPDQMAKQFAIGALSAAALHAVDGGRLANAEMKRMGNAGPRDATLTAAHESGLLLDPELANPTALNKVTANLAGHSQLQKAANAQNIQRVGTMVREELGVPDGTGLTQDLFKAKAAEMAKPYKELAGISPVAKQTLEDWQTLNHDAKDYWRAYRTTSPLPETRKLAVKATQDAQDALNRLDVIAQAQAKPGLIRDLKEARVNLAKLNAAETATNFADGSIDPRIIGDIQKETNSLTGNLKIIGDLANAMPQVMGSPTPVSVLSRVSRSAAMGGAVGAGMVAGGPAGAAVGAAAGLAGPWAAKSAGLSNTYQKFLGLPKYRTDVPDLSASVARFMTAASNRDDN